MAVAPLFEWVGVNNAATFRIGPMVGAAGRVRVDLIGRAVLDVSAAAIGLPAGFGFGREAIVGIRNASVVLLLEQVLSRSRVGIAALPKLLDKVLAFFICLQLLERARLIVGNDVDDVLIQPFFPGSGGRLGRLRGCRLVI